MSEPKGRGSDWTEEHEEGMGRWVGSDEGRSCLESGPEASECGNGVCITCSDMAVEVRVVRLLDDAMAVVDTGQGEETVSVALVTAGVGDTILVHAREAIAVVGDERV
jgi:hydrogenase expression/formation protein HypC